jgi:hypothetical protein
VCEKLVDDLQRMKQQHHYHHHQPPPKTTCEFSRSPTPDMLLRVEEPLASVSAASPSGLPELDLDVLRANQSATPSDITALPAGSITEQVPSNSHMQSPSPAQDIRSLRAPELILAQIAPAAD